MADQGGRHGGKRGGQAGKHGAGKGGGTGPKGRASFGQSANTGQQKRPKWRDVASQEGASSLRAEKKLRFGSGRSGKAPSGDAGFDGEFQSGSSQNPPSQGRKSGGWKSARDPFAPRKPHAGKPAGRPFRGHRDAGDGPVILYGWHTVSAALNNPARRFRRLLLTENAMRRVEEDGIALPFAPEIVRPDALAYELGPEAVHQGLLAETDPLEGPDISELQPEGIVLVFDQITDPHNAGAILRSASAFAVKAVVTTARHSAEASGVMAKSASGALEHVPIITVTNLARALNALKDRGFQTVGLDSEGTDDLSRIPLHAPVALVLGAEGKGLRQLTRETCDAVARLDLPGSIKSLNVSNAAALSLYVVASRLGLMGGA